MMPPQQDDCLLADFISAIWLPHIRASKASWKLDANIAKTTFCILPAFGAQRLTAITEADVERWLAGYEKYKCAPATRNRRLHVLKSIFSLAADWQLRSGMAMPTLQRCMGVTELRDLTARQRCGGARHEPVPA